MRRGRKFWEKVVAQVEAGATQAGAAARFGVTRAAVQYWVSKKRREGEDGGPQLLPVHVSAAPPAMLEIDSCGVVVRVKQQIRDYTEQINTITARIAELQEEPTRASLVIDEETGKPPESEQAGEDAQQRPGPGAGRRRHREDGRRHAPGA